MGPHTAVFLQQRLRRLPTPIPRLRYRLLLLLVLLPPPLVGHFTPTQTRQKEINEKKKKTSKNLLNILKKRDNDYARNKASHCLSVTKRHTMLEMLKNARTITRENKKKTSHCLPVSLRLSTKAVVRHTSAA